LPVAGSPPRFPGREEIRLTRTLSAPTAVLMTCLAVTCLTGCAWRPTPPAPPASARAYADGIAAYKAGDKDRAVALLTQAVKDNPNLAMAHSVLGDLHKEAGNYDEATTQYEALIRLDPYAADNHHRLAVSYHFVNRLRDAAASYLRSVRLDPRDWKSSMNLGLVYMSLGDNNASVEYCQRAANLEPTSAVAHANLGVVLDARGNAAEAEAAYRRSLALDHRQSGAAMNLARNLQSRGRAAEAASVLQRLVGTADSPSARRRYGDALAAAGRDADALRQYRQALTMDPRHYPAMNGLAALLITQYRDGLLLDDRKRDEALAMWKQSLQINPGQPKVETQLKTWAPKAG
jgi:tetratricopeptide (TPR) repeat protein